MFYQLVGIANASFYDSQIRSSNQSSLEPTYDKTQVDIRLFNILYCTSKRKTPTPPFTLCSEPAGGWGAVQYYFHFRSDSTTIALTQLTPELHQLSRDFSTSILSYENWAPPEDLFQVTPPPRLGACCCPLGFLPEVLHLCLPRSRPHLL